jgi:hypothetical protein
MCHDLGVELVAEDNDVLETLRTIVLRGISLVPDLGLAEEVESGAVDDPESVPKKMVAPKMRSKAATRRRYSLPPLAMPKVYQHLGGGFEGMVWLCCRTAKVERNKLATRLLDFRENT